jgi:hypothetical protein
LAVRSAILKTLVRCNGRATSQKPISTMRLTISLLSIYLVMEADMALIGP